MIDTTEGTFAGPVEGGCDCRQVRDRLLSAPMVVHGCHCRWCQRGTGASFALNAMFEADRVQVPGAEPELVQTPSASGAGLLVRFVRVGTLDQPDHFPPDVHIFTASTQPWVLLPPDKPAFAEDDEREVVRSADALARRAVQLLQIEAYQARRAGTADGR